LFSIAIYHLLVNRVTAQPCGLLLIILGYFWTTCYLLCYVSFENLNSERNETWRKLRLWHWPAASDCYYTMAGRQTMRDSNHDIASMIKKEISILWRWKQRLVHRDFLWSLWQRMPITLFWWFHQQALSQIRPFWTKLRSCVSEVSLWVMQYWINAVLAHVFAKEREREKFICMKKLQATKRANAHQRWCLF